MMLLQMSSLGENLKKLRKRAGMSQFVLATKSGVSLGYITKIEQGVAGKRISSFKANALAGALGTTAEELIANSASLIVPIYDEEPDPTRLRLGTKILLVPDGRLDELENFMEFLIDQGEREDDIAPTEREAPGDIGATAEGASSSVGKAE
jgi:transcriptional regulator with XRE-family HTH domain